MNTNFFASLGSFLMDCFIFIHTSGFKMISWAIQDCRRNRIVDAVIEAVCGILFILCVLALDLLALYGLYRLIRRISITLKTKETKRYRVTGVVTGKDYEDSYITATYTGKMVIPIFHNKAYNVYVKYKGVTGVFDSEEMFDKYKKGDPISLVLVKKLDKNNVVIECTLELPE